MTWSLFRQAFAVRSQRERINPTIELIVDSLGQRLKGVGQSYFEFGRTAANLSRPMSLELVTVQKRASGNSVVMSANRTGSFRRIHIDEYRTNQMDLTREGRSEAIIPALMTLASGSKLGPYEIVEPLGTGGMGEVYRAK